MLQPLNNVRVRSGLRFNMNMTSYQYRNSHCGDKTILRPSYLHNGFPILVRWHLYIAFMPLLLAGSHSYDNASCYFSLGKTTICNGMRRNSRESTPLVFVPTTYGPRISATITGKHCDMHPPEQHELVQKSKIFSKDNHILVLYMDE